MSSSASTSASGSGSGGGATKTQHVLALKKAMASAVQANDVDGILGALNRLKDEVRVTEDLVRETKIGIAVNKLRQNGDKRVADLAKEIVRKWKQDVGSSSAPSTAASTAKAGPSSKPSSSTSRDQSASQSPAPPTASTSTAATTTRDSRTPSVSAGTRDNPRTAKSDQVEFGSGPDSTGDKTREKCAQLIYDALASDSDAPTDLILKRARALEQHVYDQNESDTGKGYSAKMRSLYMNLKAANNPALRADVVSGDISISKLYNMSPAEMASEEQQALNRKLVEENLFKAQGAAPQQAETDAFQCGKCKKRRTMYYQMQTRSADEPMTTFVTCLECQNRWKFS